MNIDLREELRKRDELLDGYLKRIEIQKEFIQIKSSRFLCWCRKYHHRRR